MSGFPFIRAGCRLLFSGLWFALALCDAMAESKALAMFKDNDLPGRFLESWGDLPSEQESVFSNLYRYGACLHISGSSYAVLQMPICSVAELGSGVEKGCTCIGWKADLLDLQDMDLSADLDAVTAPVRNKLMLANKDLLVKLPNSKRRQ